MQIFLYKGVVILRFIRRLVPAKKVDDWKKDLKISEVDVGILEPLLIKF